jgi:hypothetical protein
MAAVAGSQQQAVNFLTQKFTLDADDERFDEIFDASRKIFRKIEPDATIIAR